MATDIPPFDERDDCSRDDWHAVFTVQLGELITDGVIDFSTPEWDFDSFNDEQRNRLYQKIEARFFWREIGVLPVLRWRMELLRKLNEIMPKYKYLYQAIEDGVSPFQIEDEFGKSRQIFSDFPETMLGDNQDYASNGNDREFETIRNGNYLDVAENLDKRYNDVDVMILNQLESCFSCLITVNMNAY